MIEVVAARLLNTTFPVSSGTFGFLAESGWKQRVIVAAGKPTRTGTFSSETGMDQAGRFVAPAGRKDGRGSSERRWFGRPAGAHLAAACGLHQLPHSAGSSPRPLLPSGGMSRKETTHVVARFFVPAGFLLGEGRSRADHRVPGRARAGTFFGRGRFVEAGWCQARLDRPILLRRMKAVDASLVPMNLDHQKLFRKRKFLGAGILLRKVTFFQGGNFSAKWTVSGSPWIFGELRPPSLSSER